MPHPEAHWIALGIVVAATAAALGRRRRRVFFNALRTLVDEHVGRDRVVAFGPHPKHARDLSHAIRSCAKWLTRLIDELDDGAGR